MLAVIHSYNDRYVKVVSLLLERGADPNGSSEGYKGKPLLYIASKKGEAKIMKLLIDHGANIDVRSKKGSTPLHVATKRRRMKAVKILLQEGANIDAKNDDGMTALDLAMENGDSRIFTLLHVHNRDLKRSEDRSDH
jgi:cytohesin